MSKPFKPCPGCGESMFVTKRQVMKPPMLTCGNSECGFVLLEVLPREYESAYCWKELDKARAALEAADKMADILKDQCESSIGHEYFLEYRALREKTK